MDDFQLRDLVANEVAKTHGNQTFIEQIRSGDQDDGPFMKAGFAVRDWFLAQMLPDENEIEE